MVPSFRILSSRSWNDTLNLNKHKGCNEFVEKKKRKGKIEHLFRKQNIFFFFKNKLPKTITLLKFKTKNVIKFSCPWYILNMLFSEKYDHDYDFIPRKDDHDYNDFRFDMGPT